jgi:hypothetical protein
MERSAIRGKPRRAALPFPHYAEFIIGPAEGWTQWIHAGYTAGWG